jgi:hypothetical protein
LINKENINLFDASAQEYDHDFTFSKSGILQRERVYHWLEKTGFFSVSKKVFEVNCGTGYDAWRFSEKGHQVFATDASATMIETANENYSHLRFLQADFSKASEHSELHNSDVLFSNFGGLNCISREDLKSFLEKVKENQSAGNQLIFVIMPDKCLMESIYFLMKFRFKKAFRRKKGSLLVKVNGVDVPTWYHSPKSVKSLLINDYQVKLIKPIAIFLPPSYMEKFFQRRKGFLTFLYKMELLFGRISFLSGWSDHYILIAEKR